MSLFNYLILTISCPRCGEKAEMEAEFRFGLRELIRYHIGDKLRWDGLGIKTPQERPEHGKYMGEGYVVCPKCNRDFWINITTKNDVLISAAIDDTKETYISDE